jgi:hypothetical protein
VRVLAWLYMSAPQWAVNLLPEKINAAEGGRFNEAVALEYDRRCAASYRRLRKGEL